MPNTREKLIELLEGLFVDYGATAIFFTKGEAEVIADHLIANGVTVQKWISVKDRLPEPFTDVLSYSGHRTLMAVDCVDEKGKWYSEYKYDEHPVTHWMPLPEPPKEKDNG